MTSGKRKFAARGRDHIWHWVDILCPNKDDTQNTVSRCGHTFEWRRAVVPDLDFQIDLDRGDTLCPTCHDLTEWDGFVKAFDQDLLDFARSKLRVVKPCPFCQGRVLPPAEWSTGTWCCEDQRRKNETP